MFLIRTAALCGLFAALSAPAWAEWWTELFRDVGVNLEAGG